MARQQKSDTEAKKITLSTKKRVWEKAETYEGHPPDIWRKDSNDNTINWQEFGNKHSKYGWKIAYIKPTADGGSADISNLEAIRLQ